MKPTDALPHPDGWDTTVIGNAADIKRGVSWSKDQEHTTPYDGAIPVIGISNVQDRLELDNLLYLSGLKPKAIDQKRVEKGWSIMVGSNGNRQRIGNAVYIDADAEFLFASFLVAAKPKTDSGILPEFFFRWLRSEQVQAYLSASSEGSTGLSNLSHSFFRKMTIAYPEEPEQAAISRVLDAMDEAIASTTLAIKAAQELTLSLISNVVSRCSQEHPQTDLRFHITEGPTNGLYRPEADYGAKGTPIVRIDSFSNGKITKLESLRRVVVPSLLRDRFSLKTGNVLINRVNALSHVGKAAVVPALSEPTIFESNIMSIRCSETLVPDFLGVILRSDIARKHWLARAKPAVNQVSINQRDVKSLRFPLPDPKAQGEFAKLLEASDLVVALHEKRLETLKTVKQSLMHDLLSGTKRVDPKLFKELEAS